MFLVTPSKGRRGDGFPDILKLNLVLLLGNCVIMLIQILQFLHCPCSSYDRMLCDCKSKTQC